MKLPAAILIGAVMLAGCTVQAEFAVVNQTPWPARLTVRLFEVERCSIHGRPAVAVAPASELEPVLLRRRPPDWAPLSPQQFDINEADCVLTVDLPPETAIRVARFANHPPPAKATPHLLAVQEVSMRWSRERVYRAGCKRFPALGEALFEERDSVHGQLTVLAREVRVPARLQVRRKPLDGGLTRRGGDLLPSPMHARTRGIGVQPMRVRAA